MLHSCVYVSIFFLAACTHFEMDAIPDKKEGFVTVDDGIRLYYVEKGSGPDVLIAPLALYLEPHLLEDLSKTRRMIFYDPRNRGRSDAADLSNVSLDRQIQDLEDLRVELGLEQMALLGWSGLGMEMAVYALRYPDRVTRLIQMSPVPPAASIMQALGETHSDQTDAAALAALKARAAAGEFDGAPDEYCRLYNILTGPAYFANPELAALIPDGCLYENEWPKNLWPFFNAYLASLGDYDWREDLNNLATPRLIIHGEEDRIPLAGAKAWAAGYKQARLIVLSPAGHFPYIEQKQAVVEAIETFLDGDWPHNAVAVEAASLDIK